MKIANECLSQALVDHISVIAILKIIHMIYLSGIRLSFTQTLVGEVLGTAIVHSVRDPVHVGLLIVHHNILVRDTELIVLLTSLRSSHLK